MAHTPDSFDSFKSFYPYYLQENKNKTCRLFHFIGSSLVLGVLLYVLNTGHWIWLWSLPIIGYGFAWLGHFLFEKNKPATFKHPFYSFLGDWVMYKDILTGRLTIF